MGEENQRILDKVRAEGLEISYSRETDYLYLMIGQQRESLALPTSDEMGGYLLYDPDSYVIVGMEVPFFFEKLGNFKPKADFWPLVKSLIEQHGETVYIPAVAEVTRAQEAFDDLVLV